MGTMAYLFSSAFMASLPLLPRPALSAEAPRHSESASSAADIISPRPLGNRLEVTYHNQLLHALPAQTKREATRLYGISCVPYARQVSGINVSGNAWQWWSHAAGRYARGEQPEIGSVLNFRSNGRMNLGHVAVVTRLVNPREIIVDHANWPSGNGYGHVTHNVAVVDVSEANNWSAVRVELGRRGTFGSVYPTYGFIYNRPDTGALVANTARPSPQAPINPVPSDLRPAAERPWHVIEEVAESREAAGPETDLRATAVSAHP